MKARSRSTDPSTSRAAARRASKNAGGLSVTQQSVMIVMRMLGRPVLDEELISAYEQHRKALKLPQQSESGIRSRRSELAKAGKLVIGDKAKMSTGGWGATWSVASEGDTP